MNDQRKSVALAKLIEKFGGDSIIELRRKFDGYIAQVKKF